MKFNVMRAEHLKDEPPIEINSLDELHQFAKKINETLMITFPGVSSNAWSDERRGDIGLIIIYDDYLE